MNKYIKLSYVSRDTSPIIRPIRLPFCIGEMMGEYLSKRSLIKYICSWRDKVIVLWTLNRQLKIFLRINRSVTIHIRNLQILATEFLKESKYLTSTIFKLFGKTCFMLQFFISNVKGYLHNKEKMSYLLPQTWDLVKNDLKKLWKSSKA